MPENWDDWRDFANEIIADSGFAATLRKKGAVAGGVPMGTRTARTAATQVEVEVTVVEASQASEVVPNTLRDGGPALSDVRSFYLGTDKGEKAMPEDGDTLAVRGRDLKIIRVDTTAPGGVDVVYLVHTER